MTSTAKFSYDTSGGVVTATFSASSIAGALDQHFRAFGCWYTGVQAGFGRNCKEVQEHAECCSRCSHVCLVRSLMCGMRLCTGRAANYLSGRQLKLTGHTKTLVNGNRQCLVAHIQICK